MPPKEVLKYLLDIEAIISELEDVISLSERNYEKFNSNFMAVRTTERDLEIIGEAIKNIKAKDSNLKIASAKKIIGLRNIIVHAYDAIDATLLWRILLKDLPILKEEIKAIKG